MIPQTFRAESMLQALETIQKELGPEALIISVRNVPMGPAWQVWKQPGVEVVAMPSLKPVPDKNGGSAKPIPLAVPISPKAEAETTQPKTEPADEKPLLAIPPEFSSLLKKEALKPKAAVKESAPVPEKLMLLEAELLTQGVDAEFTRRIIRSAMETLSPRAMANEKFIRDHIRQKLQAEIRARDGIALTGRRIVCTIGTSGSGKTSTCAKIAAHVGKTLGKRVVWVSADTLRAGSIAKTRALTDPLGVPLRLAYSPDELAAMVEEELTADLILVDMPGCNPHNEEEVVELGSFITTLPGRFTLLTVPASGRDADLHDALASFAPFDVKGMAVTKMDETRYYGGVYNFARRSKLPLVYFTNGARVLGDLSPADAGILASALLGEGWNK